MASYTTNLNLKKPAGSENVAIGDINNNMDLIDSAYGTLDSKITSSSWENLDTEYANIRIRKASNVCHIWIYTDKEISANTVIGVVPSGYRFSGLPYPNRIYCFDGIGMKKIYIKQDGEITLMDQNQTGNWVCLSVTWVIG